MKTLTLITVFALGCCPVAHADETLPGKFVAEKSAPATQSTKPKRWLLLCCGLPDDDGQRERLTAACTKIIASAEPTLSVSSEHLQVLAGDEEMQEALSKSTSTVGVCTKKTVRASLAQLCEQVPADGACWIVILGHAHLYGTKSQFNVLDTDFDQKEFGEWLKPLACAEQVVIMTTPISGFWIKPLRTTSRVVVTATEADLEYTGTEMPYALADVLAGEGEHAKLQDIDQDGSVSLLDLYLAANLEIHGRFMALDRLQTEHALLDDNGDGRGSELQFPYLPVDEEESSEEDAKDDTENSEAVEKPAVELLKSISNKNLDGFRSRHLLLRQPAE